MFITKKVKIEEPIEIFRVSRELKKQAALRSILYLDPVAARGLFAAELRDRAMLAFKERSVFRKMGKLGSSRVGRAYINNVVINVAKRYATESKDKIKMFREALRDLYTNREIKGSDYIKEVRNVLYKIFDQKTAQKIEKELLTRISMAELGKKGLLDPIDGRAFFKTKDRPVGFKVYGSDRINEGRKELGIRWRKTDYFEIKVGRIMLEAITSASSPEEAKRKFIELYARERERDPLFREAEIKGAFKYLMGIYNAAAIANISEKVLAMIPTRLVYMASRMLARAYAMLPLVGAIAATNAEAAAAIAEIGEGLQSKIEQSAYTWYNLKDLLGEEKASKIEKIIESSLKQAS